MAYRIDLRPEAVDDLRRLDKAVAQRVLRRLEWLADNLDSVTPESLAGQWHGLFKLRVGSYRIIYETNREDRLITVHMVGHRRAIYRRR